MTHMADQPSNCHVTTSRNKSGVSGVPAGLPESWIRFLAPGRFCIPSLLSKVPCGWEDEKITVNMLRMEESFVRLA
jgi:hypothetical protein